MEIELGPHLDIERKRYVMWSANLLDKEPFRFMVVVQLVLCDPEILWAKTGQSKGKPR
jgi:hypothetical protein